MNKVYFIIELIYVILVFVLTIMICPIVMLTGVFMTDSWMSDTPVLVQIFPILLVYGYPIVTLFSLCVAIYKYYQYIPKSFKLKFPYFPLILVNLKYLLTCIKNIFFQLYQKVLKLLAFFLRFFGKCRYYKYPKILYSPLLPFFYLLILIGLFVITILIDNLWCSWGYQSFFIKY
jgi:hypothetical protein